MTDIILHLIGFAAAMFVMHRCVLMVTLLDQKSWPSKCRFIALGISIGLLVSGAFSVVLGTAFGKWLLLAGITGFMMFDRRIQQRCEVSE